VGLSLLKKVLFCNDAQNALFCNDAQNALFCNDAQNALFCNDSLKAQIAFYILSDAFFKA
jgi:hypothetical protein